MDFSRSATVNGKRFKQGSQCNFCFTKSSLVVTRRIDYREARAKAERLIEWLLWGKVIVILTRMV